MSTGRTTPSAGRNSRSESGRSSRRSRRGEDTTPAKLSVPKHFFFSRDESRNCFNFQLKPTVNAHKRVICDGCLYTLNNAGGILTPDLISRTRGTNVKKKCQRPWDQTWKDHPDRGKVPAVAFQHEISANITSRTDELEELEERLEDDFHLTEEEARELNDRKHRLAAELEQLRGQVQSDVEANQDVIGENVDYVQMLLEQLTITNETIVELEQYVKNHNSHSARVVNTVMKSNGVDQETYFSGALVGNHCMTYAERGDKIYDGIFKELEPIIQNNNLRSELSAFTERMKAIVKLWFKIQRVIKSVEKHSDESIAQFEKDADELKELVYKLCKDDCPISGWKPKLTRSMKAHLLFGGHLVRQLRLWGTLGGIDEQNSALRPPLQLCYRA